MKLSSTALPYWVHLCCCWCGWLHAFCLWHTARALPTN